MAELNEKELNEVTGGADQKEYYVGKGIDITTDLNTCDKCGIKYSGAVCPNCRP